MLIVQVISRIAEVILESLFGSRVLLRTSGILTERSV